MPELEGLFSHRNVDCSTVNELAKRWTSAIHADRPGATAEIAHRAMADVRNSIDLARYYRRQLFCKHTCKACDGAAIAHEAEAAG